VPSAKNEAPATVAVRVVRIVTAIRVGSRHGNMLSTVNTTTGRFWPASVRCRRL